MSKRYSWGFFFEDGTREQLQLPYGPEGGNDERIWFDLDDPRFEQVYKDYPNLREVLEERPFTMVIVNPPHEDEDD